jgi:hypothetical protein
MFAIGPVLPSLFAWQSPTVGVDLEHELDRLYGVPLDDFTSERDKLARELRIEKRAEEADQVKALRKPPVPVWAANQLARRNRRDVDLLLDAGHRLRESQRGLLAGEDPEKFSQARETQREALRNLRKTAEELLAQERGSAPEATVDRVVKTAELASVSDEDRELLARGRLTEEGELSGFDALAAMAAGLPTPRPSRAPKAEPKPKGKARAPERPDRKQVLAARDELKQAKTREREAERGARAARAKVDGARKALEDAERRLAATEAELSSAADERESAEERLREVEGRRRSG